MPVVPDVLGCVGADEEAWVVVLVPGWDPNTEDDDGAVVLVF